MRLLLSELADMELTSAGIAKCSREKYDSSNEMRPIMQYNMWCSEHCARRANKENDMSRDAIRCKQP